MKKHLIEQEWFLLGQPWCHSEESGMDILAGDCDPHAGTYLFSTQVIEDDDYDEEQSKELARDIAEHIIDVHNRSLAEANQPTNCWLDKLRAEQGRVKALERQLAEVRGELEQCNQRVKDYQSDVADLEGANESLSDLRQSAEGERDKARQAFADEVIALITTEQAAMCRLYSKDKYGINKVCHRLKLFVGDLLKKPLPASDGGGE